jgi:hypothetical protein
MFARALLGAHLVERGAALFVDATAALVRRVRLRLRLRLRLGGRLLDCDRFGCAGLGELRTKLLRADVSLRRCGLR